MSTDALKYSNCRTKLHGLITGTLNEWLQCPDIGTAGKLLRVLESQVGALDGLPKTSFFAISIQDGDSTRKRDNRPPSIMDWLDKMTRVANLCSIQEISCGITHSKEAYPFVVPELERILKLIEQNDPNDRKDKEKLNGKPWAISWMRHVIGNLRHLIARSGQRCPDPNDKEAFCDYLRWVLTRGTKTESSFELYSAVELLRQAILGLIPAEQATELFWALSSPEIVHQLRNGTVEWLRHESVQFYRELIDTALKVRFPFSDTSIEKMQPNRIRNDLKALLSDVDTPVFELFLTFCPEAGVHIGNVSGIRDDIKKRVHKLKKPGKDKDRDDSSSKYGQLSLFEQLDEPKWSEKPFDQFDDNKTTAVAEPFGETDEEETNFGSFDPDPLDSIEEPENYELDNYDIDAFDRGEESQEEENEYRFEPFL